MASPLQIKAGFADSPLVVDDSVSLRIFRIETTVALKWLGYGFATAIPIGVLDRTVAPSRFLPIFDFSFIRNAVAIAGLLVCLSRFRPGRKGRPL